MSQFSTRSVPADPRELVREAVKFAAETPGARMAFFVGSDHERFKLDTALRRQLGADEDVSRTYNHGGFRAVGAHFANGSQLSIFISRDGDVRPFRALSLAWACILGAVGTGGVESRAMRAFVAVVATRLRQDVPRVELLLAI